MIVLKNKELVNFLKCQFNQKEDMFEMSDLLRVEELVLDSRNFADELTQVDFEELKYFKGLKILSLNNLKITSNDISIISNLSYLEEIVFENCIFDDNIGELLNLNIENLSLNNCKINENNFIYSMTYLKKLTLIKSYLNLSKLKKFYFLKSLNLTNSIVTKVDELDLPILEEFVIDFSNIEDLNFLLNIPTLRKLSVCKEQINKNKNIIKTLIGNGVEIWENNIIKLSEVI